MIAIMCPFRHRVTIIVILLYYYYYYWNIDLHIILHILSLKRCYLNHMYFRNYLKNFLNNNRYFFVTALPFIIQRILIHYILVFINSSNFSSKNSNCIFVVGLVAAWLSQTRENDGDIRSRNSRVATRPHCRRMDLIW